MISKKQVTEFGKKILEEKIVAVMLIIILTQPLWSTYGVKNYFIDSPITIIITLVMAILVIPNSRKFVGKYIKYIKNTLAISIILYGLVSYFLNNYGGLRIGGDILVFLSIFLIIEANPIIINSIKKWWTADKKEDNFGN